MAEPLALTVSFSPAPRQVFESRELTLPAGATVAQALERSGLYESYPALRGQPLLLAIWGRTTSLTHTLKERDRVEVLRPLQVDPKVARRERFVRQGSRGAGLFAKKPARRLGD